MHFDIRNSMFDILRFPRVARPVFPQNSTTTALFRAFVFRISKARRSGAFRASLVNADASNEDTV